MDGYLWMSSYFHIVLVFRMRLQALLLLALIYYQGVAAVSLGGFGGGFKKFEDGIDGFLKVKNRHILTGIMFQPLKLTF